MAETASASVHKTEAKPTLDLSALPPIFVSATHFETEDLHELEEQLSDANASLTYDIHEARIVLSKVTRKARIQFDLRAKGLWTEEVKPEADSTTQETRSSPVKHAAKRRRLEEGKTESEVIEIDDSSTASEGGASSQRRSKKPASSKTQNKRSPAAPVRTPSPEPSNSYVLKVVKIEWFEESKNAGKILPLEAYLSYQGRPIEKPAEPVTPKSATIRNSEPVPLKQSSPSKGILERAKEDAPATDHSRVDRFGKRKFGYGSRSTAGARWEHGHTSTKKELPQLIHTTTSENEGSFSDLPEMPEWVKQRVKYACQRSTPRENPNEDFIGLLKKIKLARLLTNDEVGVRAYSTSIASLAAYPHRLSSPREILALPGCENKIASLFVEWKNTGTLEAVEDIEANEELKVLKVFYEIWGVGATTAREFYYERGWQELDDIVEFGWSTLTRVQQIGVKYYDEFLDPIPRAEVEQIGRIVHEHAVKVRDERVQSLIVGGYRRGKEASGDVDMIVSHPDEDLTLNVVSDIVASLEEEGWVTHTLLLSLNSTNRGQQTLPFRTGGGGHGFDTLDKALVVWQDPHWPNKDADLAADPNAKNPNIHRRVDIIVSPWRTVGCAVTGWSGGTTFQRDIRRYAKYAKGWKFDSSGVRSRMNGEVVDLEGWHEYKGSIGKGKAKTMEEAEKRVFEGLGLVYREPWERCTG